MQLAPQSPSPRLVLPGVRIDPDAVRRAIAWADAAYRACDVCAEACGVDRHAAPGGRCGLGVDARVYKEYLHLGEERLFVPGHAVYLSGCSFRCAFCSDDRAVRAPLSTGVVLSPEALAARVAKRRQEGATNVNFVGGVPDVNMLFLLKTIALLPPDTNIIWNTNFWTTHAAIDHLRSIVGTWLVDFKFGDDRCGLRLAGARGYVARLRDDLAWLLSGPGPAPLARPFAFIRHLLMPGHLDCCTRPVLQLLAERHPEIPVNLMTVYHPDRMARAGNAMAGRVAPDEVRDAIALLETLPFAWRLVDGVELPPRSPGRE